MKERGGSGLYPADTASSRPPTKPLTPDLHVLEKPAEQTAETVRDAQIVIAGRAYQQGWTMAELLQVLDSLDIRPVRRVTDDRLV